VRRGRGSNATALAVGALIFLGAGALARRGVSKLEGRAFRMANDLPDQAFPAVWVLMQYGTFGTVPALASLALVRRRPRLALAIGVAGTTAWALAKAVKPVVGRGRPGSLLTRVNLRGKEEGDLGFPSGHAAVSAALTVAAWPHLAKRWRWLPVGLAAFVPFARLYVGAHLPLDVLGGSAFGLVVGSGVGAVLG
jgi:membrane-associated phospholipid phosphatase